MITRFKGIETKIDSNINYIYVIDMGDKKKGINHKILTVQEKEGWNRIEVNRITSFVIQSKT